MRLLGGNRGHAASSKGGYLSVDGAASTQVIGDARRAAFSAGAPPLTPTGYAQRAHKPSGESSAPKEQRSVATGETRGDKDQSRFAPARAKESVCCRTPIPSLLAERCSYFTRSTGFTPPRCGYIPAPRWGEVAPHSGHFSLVISRPRNEYPHDAHWPRLMRTPPIRRRTAPGTAKSIPHNRSVEDRVDREAGPEGTPWHQSPAASAVNLCIHPNWRLERISLDGCSIPIADEGIRGDPAFRCFSASDDSVLGNKDIFISEANSDVSSFEERRGSIKVCHA